MQIISQLLLHNRSLGLKHIRSFIHRDVVPDIPKRAACIKYRMHVDTVFVWPLCVFNHLCKLCIRRFRLSIRMVFASANYKYPCSPTALSRAT